MAIDLPLQSYQCADEKGPVSIRVGNVSIKTVCKQGDPSMKKQKAEHLVQQGEHMRCRHCGALEKTKTPAYLQNWEKQIRDFIERHKGCTQTKYEGSDL